MSQVEDYDIIFAGGMCLYCLCSVLQVILGANFLQVVLLGV